MTWSGLGRACSARFSYGYVLLLDAVNQHQAIELGAVYAVNQHQAIALGAVYAGLAPAASVLVPQRREVTD